MMSRMTTGTSRRGRPPKGESRLSREAIVQATLQVIEADGVNAVSMRAVGRVLGVDAKSLYNHVDGKDGLLDAVAEHLLGAVVLPEPTGDPRADLRAIADAFRERALTHPEAASSSSPASSAPSKGSHPSRRSWSSCATRAAAPTSPSTSSGCSSPPSSARCSGK